MSLRLSDTAPNFQIATTTGNIDFHQWAGDSWVFFFSHPADFTPVCTTEMGRTAQLAGEFAARNVKPLGLSTDSVEEHLKWIEGVNDAQNTTLSCDWFHLTPSAGGGMSHAMSRYSPARKDAVLKRNWRW